MAAAVAVVAVPVRPFAVASPRLTVLMAGALAGPMEAVALRVRVPRAPGLPVRPLVVVVATAVVAVIRALPA